VWTGLNAVTRYVATAAAKGLIEVCSAMATFGECECLWEYGSYWSAERTNITNNGLGNPPAT